MIEDMRGIIDGFNIDIKSFGPKYYKKFLKGSLEGVLDTLKRLKEGGFWVECTTLIIPGDNDSDQELTKIARFIAGELDPYTPWHISAFHPDYKVRDKGPAPGDPESGQSHRKKAGLAFYLPGQRPRRGDHLLPRCGLELIVRRGLPVSKNILVNGRCPLETEIEGYGNEDGALRLKQGLSALQCAG